MERYGLDSSASGQGPVVDSYKHSNKLTRATKGRESLEQLSDCQLLKYSTS
jgi:hypothetical protein